MSWFLSHHSWEPLHDPGFVHGARLTEGRPGFASRSLPSMWGDPPTNKLTWDWRCPEERSDPVWTWENTPPLMFQDPSKIHLTLRETERGNEENLTESCRRLAATWSQSRANTGHRSVPRLLLAGEGAAGQPCVVRRWKSRLARFVSPRCCL